jgi:hypothetical protein
MINEQALKEWMKSVNRKLNNLDHEWIDMELENLTDEVFKSEENEQ